MIVDVDVGRPVSVTGLSWLYATVPGDGLGEPRPVGRSALHHVDLPQTWLGIGGDERGVSGRVAGRRRGVDGCDLEVTRRDASRREVGRREQVVVHRVVGGVVRRVERHVEVPLTPGHVHVERLDLPGTARHRAGQCGAERATSRRDQGTPGDRHRALEPVRPRELHRLGGIARSPGEGDAEGHGRPAASRDGDGRRRRACREVLAAGLEGHGSACRALGCPADSARGRGRWPTGSGPSRFRPSDARPCCAGCQGCSLRHRQHRGRSWRRRSRTTAGPASRPGRSRGTPGCCHRCWSGPASACRHRAR